MPSTVMVCAGLRVELGERLGPVERDRFELQAVGGVGEDRVAEGLEVLVAVAVHAASLGRGARPGHDPTEGRAGAQPGGASKSTARRPATSDTTASGRVATSAGSSPAPQVTATAPIPAAWAASTSTVASPT